MDSSLNPKPADSGALSDADYQALCAFLESASGIVLGDNKHYLVVSRLGRLVKEHDFASVGDLVRKLDKGASMRLRQDVVDAMTTNETMWFRDTYPFELLSEKLLPEFARREASRLRIWSAACSSGQESYSISMTISEFNQKNPGLLRSSVEIVGTDISPSMLEIARTACYDDLFIGRGLSEERRQRFFRQAPCGWQLTDEVRARTRFSELNLMASYALLGRFDIIFCRNVLIYFSAESKRDILERMAQALNPGGYLFLGGSESPTGYTEVFEPVNLGRGVVYRPRR